MWWLVKMMMMMLMRWTINRLCVLGGDALSV